MCVPSSWQRRPSVARWVNFALIINERKQGEEKKTERVKAREAEIKQEDKGKRGRLLTG